jgi:hypothetical protein
VASKLGIVILITKYFYPIIAIFDRPMRLIETAFIALFICGALPSLGAEDPRQSYNLRPGEVYLLEIEIDQDTHSESFNSDAISLYSRSVMEFRVDSLAKPDLIYMTVRYRELVLSMLAPEMEVDVNSTSGSNPLLTNLMDSLEVTSFSLVTDSRGVLLKLKGLDQRFDLLASLPLADTTERGVILSTLREVYGPDAFSSLFNLFVSVYPVIQPLSNWTNDITYFFNTKPVGMVNRYQLSRTTEEIMIIQGMGMISEQGSFREHTELGEVESKVSGNQTYDFQMDRASGWIKKGVSRQRVVIETTIVESDLLPKGLQIPSFTETVFEVSGSKL